MHFILAINRAAINIFICWLSSPYILYFFSFKIHSQEWNLLGQSMNMVVASWHICLISAQSSALRLSSERNKCSLLSDKLRNVFISVRKTQDSVWERSWRSAATSQRWKQYYLVTKFSEWAHLECGPGGSLAEGGIHTESLAPKLRRNGRVFLVPSCSESQGWAPQCHRSWGVGSLARAYGREILGPFHY